MGFSILKEFPSRFLSGDEIGTAQVPVVIREVKKEKARSVKTQKEEPVLVVYFEGKDRGVALGKERAYELMKSYGDDTDQWKGKKAIIYTEKKSAFGRILNVIHFKPAL